MHLDKHKSGAAEPEPDPDADKHHDAPPGREGILAQASRGTQGGGTALPFLDQIQRAFGRHDIRNIQAHVGGQAQQAAKAIGAAAYANGDHVVFGVAPDLHTAAHEAAHVVQQRAGHAPSGGVGEVGDTYEQHADEVAARVVRGESAEAVLDRLAPGPSKGPAPARGVQMKKGMQKGEECQHTDFPGIHTIEDVINENTYLVKLSTQAEPVRAPQYKINPVTEHARQTMLRIERQRIESGQEEKPKPEPKKTQPEPEPVLPIVEGAEVTVKDVPGIHKVVKVEGATVIVSVKGKSQRFPKWNVATLTARTREVEMEAERNRRLTVGDKCKCPMLAGDHTVVYDILEDRGEVLILDDGKQHLQAQRWMIVSTLSEPYVKPAQTAGEHSLITDELAKDETEQRVLSTPSGVRSEIRDYEGKHVTVGKPELREFKETARIDVTSKYDETGVTIDFTVLSNPQYMCVRKYPKGHPKAKEEPEIKDLVPLRLEIAPDTHPELITVVEPSSKANVVSGTVTYTWKALAQAIVIVGAKEMTETEAKKAVIEKTKMLGVKAQWLAEVAGKNNQNHTSGGIRQKGGSGAVPLDKIDNSSYLDTEKTKRITEWNMGERLKTDRPAFKKFESIMQAGKELATTLEAESEFQVNPVRFETVVKRMTSLSSTKEYWKRFNILKMTKSDPKEYVDTYYDIAGSGSNDNALLQRGIVLRERHVKGDPEDTFLFAVKGASFEKPTDHSKPQDTTKPNERIRLAAQVNLNRKTVLDNEGKGEVPSTSGAQQLDALVKDTSVDNPFGRTLDHALSGGKNVEPDGKEMERLMGTTGHIRPALQIKSKRHKFLMELEGGTAIDFSADAAEGHQLDPATGKVVERKDPAPIVHSFEFGVGHPSLTASATPSNSTQSGGPTVERPYHVPLDLENPALFEKKDYKQFEELRDGVINEALVDKGETLKRGGNKAQLLAGALGMIKAPKE